MEMYLTSGPNELTTTYKALALNEGASDALLLFC